MPGFSSLLDSIHANAPIPDIPEGDPTDGDPYQSPDEIPMAAKGCLLYMACTLFSAELTKGKIGEVGMAIFPDHAKLVAQLHESEDQAVLDALLAVGLWLEHHDHFVTGPLDDSNFLEYLHGLSYISATNASPKLRYAAYVLTSAVLHAHPQDRVRLAFISSILESDQHDVGHEALKVSAVSWLKKEILTAQSRAVQNVFSSFAAVRALSPYLFSDLSSFDEIEDDIHLVLNFMLQFSFHMSVVNFLIFLTGRGDKNLVLEDIRSNADKYYVQPLEQLHTRLSVTLANEYLKSSLAANAVTVQLNVELLGNRLGLLRRELGAVKEEGVSKEGEVSKEEEDSKEEEALTEEGASTEEEEH